MKQTVYFFSCCLSVSLWAQTPDHSQMHPGDPKKGVAAGGHMDRHFDDAEQWAKQFDDPARDEWQMPDRLIAALGLKKSQAVADIGAGTGYLSVRLAKSAAAPTVYAIDIEPSMVIYIKNRAVKEGLKNIIGVEASADSANIPQPVDLIVVLDTYHHIPNREVYFRKLAASLKPGGRVAIIDWKRGGPMGPPNDFRFTPEQITEELTKSGYKRIQQHNFLPNQHFQMFRVAKGK
jgi:SAM-dependent methyltransferase